MKNLWLSMLCCVPFFLHAQPTLQTKIGEIKFGQVFKDSKYFTVDDIYEPDGKEFVMYSTCRPTVGKIEHTLKLNRFDDRLARRSESDIHFGEPILRINDDIEGIVKLNGKYIAALSTVDGETDKVNNLTLQEFDPKSLKFVGDANKLMSTKLPTLKKKLLYSHDELASQRILYSIGSSPDKSKGLIVAHSLFMGKKDDRLGFVVFNSDAKAEWVSEVELGIEKSESDLVQSGMNDNGDIFALVRVYSMGKRRNEMGYEERTFPTYHFRLYYISNKGNDVANYDIILEDKYLVEARLASISDPNKIIMAGMYGKLSRTTMDHKGMFSLTIDVNEGSLTKQSYKDLPASSYMKRATSAKEEKMLARRKVPKFAPFELQDPLLYPDGSILLTGFQYNIQYWSGDENRYHYGGLQVCRISADGEILWASTVPRGIWFKESNYEYGEPATALVDDKVYLIYACSKLNFPEFKSKTLPGMLGNQVTAAVEVSPEGKVTRHLLFNNKKQKNFLDLSTHRQISSNELVVFARYKSELQAVRFAFK